MKSVIQSQGYLGLFRGIMSLSLPAFLTNGVIFVAYNWIYALCQYESKYYFKNILSTSNNFL